MKRLFALLFVIIFVLTSFVGCKSENSDSKKENEIVTSETGTNSTNGVYEERYLYNGIYLGNYVELKDYIGIEVDTQNEVFAKYYDNVFAVDVEENGLYKDVKEGVVKNGDIINLDYEGKLDGVAFEGGTAKGAELEIGSKTFIDDFEEELIGVAVGQTKDVTARFPDNYGKEELNGKEAIFTCKVNSIKKPMTEEEAYEEMNFDSAEDYKKDIKERAVKQYILDEIVSKSKIKDYPSNDSKLICEAIFDFYVRMYKEAYGVDFEDILVSGGTSVEEYKSQISTEMVPQMMNVNMIMYYIFDTEKLELLESTVNSQNVSQPIIAESYAVQDVVLDYLYENAKIK